MAEETGDETVADVLERVGALKKDEMVEEVEAYGLEVHSSWTKDEIMDHFEEFLTSPEASDVEETDDVKSDAKTKRSEKDADDDDADDEGVRAVDLLEDHGVVEGAPGIALPESGDVSDALLAIEADAAAAEGVPTADNPTADARITRSRAWGQTQGAHAP
jgi:hypothetical protein